MKLGYVFFIFLISISSLVSEEAVSGPERGKESHDEIEKLDQGSNLEKKQYKEISEKNREKIVNGIKLLTIMSANFGEEVPDSKAGLEKLRKEYQVALRYYYRNAFVISGKSIQKVEKELSDLLSKFAALYDARTQTILSNCVDAMMEQEHAQLVADSQENGKQDPHLFQDLSDSNHKLKIGYSQLALATQMVKDRRYYESVVHYRISKDYGLQILINLKESEADKKIITDNYAKDLADNQNLISNSSSQAK